MNPKIYASAVMILAGLLQVYSAWAEVELFPFTPFAMYSASTEARELRILRIACVKQHMNSEKFVGEFDMFLQESDYTAAIAEFAEVQGPLNDSQIAYVRPILAPLYKALQQDCSSLKVYRYYWKQFTGKNRTRPDQKDLVYEYAEGSTP